MSKNVQHMNPAAVGFNGQRIDTAQDGTVEIGVEGVDGITLFFNYTRSGATGNITWEIHRRSSADGNYYPLQTYAVAAGVTTYSKYVGTKATASVSQKWSADYEMTGFDRLKIMQVLASGGVPVAGDIISISAAFWSLR